MTRGAVVACGLVGLIVALGVGRSPEVSASIQRGRQVVDAGDGRGVTGCATCHGTDGSGRWLSGIPALAGLDAVYLAKQLRDFASGERKHFFMEPISRELTEDDLVAVTEYYASLEPVAPMRGELDPHSLRYGSLLADQGLEAKGIPACNGCHGPGGVGLPPLAPRLRGQSAAYVKRQFKIIRKGLRDNDPTGVMKEIAEKLTPAEVAAVAEYYEHLGSKPPARPVTIELGDDAEGAISTEALAVYAQRCAGCHGNEGRGDGPAGRTLRPAPRDFRDESWQRRVTDEQVARIIVRGGPSAGLSVLMPANRDLGRRPELVDGLVQLVRSFEE